MFFYLFVSSLFFHCCLFIFIFLHFPTCVKISNKKLRLLKCCNSSFKEKCWWQIGKEDIFILTEHLSTVEATCREAEHNIILHRENRFCIFVGICTGLGVNPETIPSLRTLSHNISIRVCLDKIVSSSVDNS